MNNKRFVFRFHRGGLTESMETAVKFSSLKAVCAYVANWYYKVFDEKISIYEVRIEFYHLGPDTFIVSVPGVFFPSYFPCGFLTEIFDGDSK